jgi:hypothetical protein
MHTPRNAELCLEAAERAAEVVEKLDEYAAAKRAGGGGIHRDPCNVFRELREEARDLLATVREARDEIEREARGRRP